MKKVVGIRPGEKVHEDLITSAESFSTIDIGDYVILPNPEYHLGRHDKSFHFARKSQKVSNIIREAIKTF